MTRDVVQQPDMLNTLQPTVARNFEMPGDTLDAEMWLAGRMREHGVDSVFDGVTDSDVRKQRFRQHIIEGGLEMVMACHAQDGRTAETYAEAFERIYGEPLELEVTKRRRKNVAPGAKGEGAVSVPPASSPSPGSVENTPSKGAVMNPPESAAEGSEAGNRETPDSASMAEQAALPSAYDDDDNIAF